MLLEPNCIVCPWEKHLRPGGHSQEVGGCLQALRAVPPVLLAPAGSGEHRKARRFLLPEELAVWRDGYACVLRKF